MRAYIYGLYESNSPNMDIRYVGKTINPAVRLEQHLADKSDTHKARWIRRTLLMQKTVYMHIIEEIEDMSDVYWEEREKYWIHHMRELGCDLTNGTDGGAGTPNVRLSSRKECPVCDTIFQPTRHNLKYCSKDCKEFKRNENKLVRPERRNLFMHKYCPWDCQCNFCQKVVATVTDEPYVNPRLLDPFSLVKSHIL